MDEYVITLRIIHLLAGVFWVGTALFIHFFLEPAVSKSGPAGGQVMGTIAGSKFPLANPSPEHMAQGQALQHKLKQASLLTAILLVIAVLGMAVARYLY